MIESKKLPHSTSWRMDRTARFPVSISGILRGMRVVTLDHTASWRILPVSDGEDTGTADLARAFVG